MNIEQIQHRIVQAERLQIIGNNSQLKTTANNTLNMSPYAGFIAYHPDELVMTVKAGTPVAEIISILKHKNQILPFTVHNNNSATIGGTYAIGSPELRDAVLGVKVIDGQGQILTFGGQVMKNVAGYDVSRLLVGSKGKLVAVCEISFRVLPQAYINTVKLTIAANIETQSNVRQRIEQGLKKVFDPKGIFI
jgi:glycolate oxidase FAD binding subunit